MNIAMRRALCAALYIAGVLLADVCCAQAQFPDITLPDGRGLTPMASGPGTPVDDLATNVNADITATSVTVGGMSGGFDPNLALAPDLQQQVSSTDGLPLDNGTISARYPTLWPGYGNANYGQSYANGSPEGNMLTTLGTLQGTLQASADQQDSQAAELNRLEALETENADATGIFQLLQIGNEAAYFVAEQEMKLRNSTNAQLNALVVAESNRQNKQAQDELLSLGVMTQIAQWDLTQSPIIEPVLPDPPPYTTCGLCQTE
jgi:hypothetical protein